jgi:carboxymethylenebutenolidase
MGAIDVEMVTADGTCGVSVHLPEGSGPWPAVIMYPDAGGVRGTFRVMGERLAGLGYVTLVPDVYYRSGGYEPFDLATVFTDSEERARLMGLAGSLTSEMIVRDGRALLDHLAGREEVADGPVGTTGYCMGGRISLTVAGHYPERVGAAASFHGGRLAVDGDPDSPHLLANRVRATVYVGAAENDDSFGPDQHGRLAEAYATAGVRYSLETYGAAHGFAVPDNPTYDPPAEARHWTALAALYAAAFAATQ